MAKRRRDTRSEPRPAAASEREPDEPGDGREADPLALVPWPSAQCSDEEAVERKRFERAWESFVRGDFRGCRAEAAALASEARAEEVRFRAQALGARLDVDPLGFWVAAGALALLLSTLLMTFG